MNNFVKNSFEVVNGEIKVGIELMPRSLVLFNDKGAMFNVTAKVRNTDKFSVIRALAKAVLASIRETVKKNSTESAQKSKKRVINVVTKALSSHLIMVTDKNGSLITNSVFSVRENGTGSETLRNMMKFAKNQPIYQLVIEQGLDWSEPIVVEHLNAWVQTAIEQLDYVKNLDEALGAAANSTDEEGKSSENELKSAA